MSRAGVMISRRYVSFAAAFLALVGLAPGVETPGASRAASPETVKWFQKTEQELVDSIAKGDKSVYDRVMDAGCIVTSEEGEVTPKKEFLAELTGLPPGLRGQIAIRDLSVQEFGDFAIVRCRLDEGEEVFGQKLETKYRVTDTFRRDGPTWKMVASHCSVVTQDPPAQNVSKAGWPALAGSYRLLPNGWTLTVELRDGKLYGGRDPKKLREFIPLTPDAFVFSGSLGEWIFVRDERGKVTHILDFRKFEPLVWTRVETGAAPRSSSPSPSLLPVSQFLVHPVAGPNVRAIMFARHRLGFFRLTTSTRPRHPGVCRLPGGGRSLLPAPDYLERIADCASLRAYIARVLTLVGWPDARERASKFSI